MTGGTKKITVEEVRTIAKRAVKAPESDRISGKVWRP